MATPLLSPILRLQKRLRLPSLLRLRKRLRMAELEVEQLEQLGQRLGRQLVVVERRRNRPSA